MNKYICPVDLLASYAAPCVLQPFVEKEDLSWFFHVSSVAPWPRKIIVPNAHKFPPCTRLQYVQYCV